MEKLEINSSKEYISDAFLPSISFIASTDPPPLFAERIKLWPFFLFAAILAGIIYPIVMGWQWGGGWLAAAGFSDFAGSTLVSSL